MSSKSTKKKNYSFNNEKLIYKYKFNQQTKKYIF